MGCFRMLQRGGGSPFSLEREQVKILVWIQNDLAKQGSFQESLLTAQMINAKMLETFSKILIERSKSWEKQTMDQRSCTWKRTRT